MQVSEAIDKKRRASIGWLALAGLVAQLPATVLAHEGHAPGSAMGKGKSAELASSVAFDANGDLWLAGKHGIGEDQYLGLQLSRDLGKTWSAPRNIQSLPEEVSADGENRPKLAFGPGNAVYISYTRPLSKPYTGEIRFLRSLDGGQTFLPAITVHANRQLITHRFESMIVDRSGRIFIAWIDKRDMEAALAKRQKYEGAAVYYAVSEDCGASFKGDFKIADHSCECCRIALALNPQGEPVAMWRHVFEPNSRDHAMQVLRPDGKPGKISRATFDDWRVDACPHHGPSLAYGADGRRHQTWFNVKGEQGGIFYATADSGGRLGTPVQLGAAQAEHADVAVLGKKIVIVWKEFDGTATTIFAKISSDNGESWRQTALAATKGASDQPRLAASGKNIHLVWRTSADGILSVSATTGET
ncbi:sialidase family protein [Undibacterium sp. TJN25]|uniref:sialidase family protein n=1 Tax=Undibacterium sp. TJN25 TaxID=3413056 RepID=UPI003BF05A5B